MMGSDLLEQFVEAYKLNQYKNGSHINDAQTVALQRDEGEFPCEVLTNFSEPARGVELIIRDEKSSVYEFHTDEGEYYLRKDLANHLNRILDGELAEMPLFDPSAAHSTARIPLDVEDWNLLIAPYKYVGDDD